MAGWIADGKLQRKYHSIEGLENAPEGINLLYNGGNTGKLYVMKSFYLVSCQKDPRELTDVYTNF